VDSSPAIVKRVLGVVDNLLRVILTKVLGVEDSQVVVVILRVVVRE
jgi:hypothetical protein